MNTVCNPNNEFELKQRSKGVIDIMISESLKEKNFLDFGCGTGHMAFEAAVQKAKVSVGYDIKYDKTWDLHMDRAPEEGAGGLLLIEGQWEAVVESGPYDVVLLFDVLDHVQGDQPAQVMRKSFIRPQTRRQGVRANAPLHFKACDPPVLFAQ
jgi:2-polyprenyl-3-methyl-5-hydroxy-6-metoxy-1,4-benzoquinol methylase